MSLLTTFVAAVLLSDAASLANGNLSPSTAAAAAASFVSAHVTARHQALDFGDSVSTASTATSLLSSSSSKNSSISTIASLTLTVSSWDRETFCGHHSHQRCLAFYTAGVVGFIIIIILVLCAAWVVRWRRCSVQGLRGWRRANVDADNGLRHRNEDEEYGAERTERERLLGGYENRHSDGDGEGRDEAESEGQRRTVGERMAGCFQRLNLHGTRFWTFLRMSPAAILYGASEPSTPAQSPAAAPPRWGLPISDNDGAVSSDGGVSRDALWAHSRADHGAAVPSSNGRSFLHDIISVATTTTDSSESGNDSGRHSDNSEGLGGERDHRSLLCERECLCEDLAEDECGVRRSAVSMLPPSSPITPHILPQLFHYRATSSCGGERSDGAPGEDDAVGVFADNTDSDSQQMGNAAGAGPRRTSLSSMTASANSSMHTPPFLPADSALSDSHFESKDHDGVAAVSTTSPARFPHVATAIFDAPAAHGGLCTAATHVVGVDASVANALFEPDHFPPGLVHGGSDGAAASSAASLVSVLDCYTPPPATVGTAAPASNLGSGFCNPVPIAATPTIAVMPVSNSLSEGLDIEGEPIVKDLGPTQQSRSYVPATQQKPPHPQPPVVNDLSPPPPPQPEPRKSRRKRSDSYYSEPWQPVLVQRSDPEPTAPALPVVAVPVSSVVQLPMETALHHTLPPPQPQQQPTRCSMHSGGDLCGDLEDELDDLMLGGDDDATAQSNCTGEWGHIFSGYSTSTSRTVTPAAGADPESAIGTPTMFCEAAVANGGRNSNNSACPALLTVSPPASASIPLHPESPPVAIFARTVGAGGNFFGPDDMSRGFGKPQWTSCSVGRGPLNLSVEERTLLMKSRKWLFPLIDGADEIETSVVSESDVGEKADESVPLA